MSPYWNFYRSLRYKNGHYTQLKVRLDTLFATLTLHGNPIDKQQSYRATIVFMLPELKVKFVRYIYIYIILYAHLLEPPRAIISVK